MIALVLLTGVLLFGGGYKRRQGRLAKQQLAVTQHLLFATAHPEEYKVYEASQARRGRRKSAVQALLFCAAMLAILVLVAHS